ncbi:hypothetical protein CkaCkLH20_10736 [Colletotrichum karsti]|uniref:Uncharacterized protein n=1 Tax=Colletotrichum karsti TaxID=1095194 RepID=A0A9P6LGU3_9PEZI|nr:uncharacterized protein CkaCkLH20_10736 [Colletotrichum karsti]KAF9871802.1 hypothetical protein CkaCkLH20_10736 [Colletotrichum karsti]
MDTNTPLHPDITTLPPDTGQRHGDFLTAIPYNRSMYRTTFSLRAASVLFGLITLGILASQIDTDLNFIQNWAMGSPTAILAILWSLADIIALVVRDRGVRWTKDDGSGGRRQRSTRFSWGSPGGHVAGHLFIWAPAAAMMGVTVAFWLDFMEYDRPGRERELHTMTGLIVSMFCTMVIHFALFVFACVEVDNAQRQYSDVVFVPRGELSEMVPVPPTTPWEIFVPKKMSLSFFANHYVRFVPGVDGTVTVARDYSSRQARF